MTAQATTAKFAKQFAERYFQGQLPGDLLILDCETTGLNTYQDRIIQLGVSLYTRGRQRVFGVYLKHDSPVEITQSAWSVHGITNDLLNERGLPSKEVVPSFVNTLNRWVGEGNYVGGINIVAFDYPLLHREAKLANCELKFTQDNLIDVGLIAKASQAELSFTDNESLSSFYARVLQFRAKSVKWSLDYLTKLFTLSEQRGDKHNAIEDCKLIGKVYHELLKQTTE